MKNNNTTADDLKTIRQIMEGSTRFLSLSGLSGVFTGSLALAGAIITRILIISKGMNSFGEVISGSLFPETGSVRMLMALIAATVLILSLAIAFYFSYRKAKKAGEKFITPVSRRLLINLFIPLATGGLFALIISAHNHLYLVIPVFLIFYGLALVNAGKFTYGEIFYLGIMEIVTGLMSAIFPDMGLLFWSLGFGLLHIAYGLFMYRKYEA